MFQKTTLIGRLTADAENRFTQSGTAITKFTVVTSRKHKDQNGQLIEKSAFHRCELWGKRAEALGQYLKKGKLVHVEAEIEYGDYMNKDNQKVYTTTLKVEDITLMPNGGGYQQQGGAPQNGGGYQQQGGAPQNGGGNQQGAGTADPFDQPPGF